MANHVSIVHPRRPPLIQVPPYTVHKAGKDLAHTNKTTVDVTIHTCQINAFICPETGKPQEYRHIMNGPDKPKYTRGMTN